MALLALAMVAVVVAAVMLWRAAPPPPGQVPKEGAPPATESKQSVPAPPVAVKVIVPFASELYATPFAAGVPLLICVVWPLLPITTEVALVLPMLTAAAPPASSVKALAPPDLIVRAPESAMLLVVKVWEPITVPVMKVPTPALVILVVPAKVRLPAVMATSPAVTTKPPAVIVSPPEATVKPVRPVRTPAPDNTAVGVLIKLVKPVAEVMLIPLTVPLAPAARLRRLEVFPVLVAAFSVMESPVAVFPAAAAELLVKLMFCNVPVVKEVSVNAI
jgi:hypothetical protein